MSRYEVLLFLHVLSAFATVTVVVLLTTFAIATRRATAASEALPVLRLSGLARRLWDVAGLGTLVFGIWLALDVDGYDLLDGWIVTAIVLWIVAAGTGTRVGMTFQEARQAAERGEGDLAALLRDGRTRFLHVLMAIAVAALLVVMIIKPGA
jgi:uncharacterized membrane protein